MAEVLTEIDFQLIDEDIQAKKLAEDIKTNIETFIEEKAEWDEIPAEKPPIIDWAKINANKPGISNGSGFDWSRYKRDDEDDFFNSEIDLQDFESNSKTDDNEDYFVETYTSYNDIKKKSNDDDFSYYRNTSSKNHWWDEIGKNKTYDDNTLADIYNMIAELQTRVDTMSSNIDDLADMVKSQYKTMMAVINAIYKRVNF